MCIHGFWVRQMFSPSIPESETPRPIYRMLCEFTTFELHSWFELKWELFWSGWRPLSRSACKCTTQWYYMQITSELFLPKWEWEAVYIDETDKPWKREKMRAREKEGVISSEVERATERREMYTSFFSFSLSFSLLLRTHTLVTSPIWHSTKLYTSSCLRLHYAPIRFFE